MLSHVVAFLAMLNPFALFLYLEPLRKDLSHQAFRQVFVKATLISYAISLVFLFTGDFIFERVFQIHFEAFRVFGGIIIFSFAYLFIVKGQKAFIQMKANLTDLASEIALPFMVGAGTISLAVLLYRDLGLVNGAIALTITFALVYLIVLVLKGVRDAIEKKKFKTAFDKHMEILLRLNGFFLGSIGVNMVVLGVENLFL